MKQKNASSAGGFQPFLFFIGMSLVTLTFSVFICFSLFYAVQSANPVAGQKKVAPTEENVASKGVLTSFIN